MFIKGVGYIGVTTRIMFPSVNEMVNAPNKYLYKYSLTPFLLLVSLVI
jgi:hypothetical protein